MERVVRSAEEIRKLADMARDADPKYYSMKYEEGIAAALEWVLGDTEADEIL